MIPGILVDDDRHAARMLFQREGRERVEVVDEVDLPRNPSASGVVTDKAGPWHAVRRDRTDDDQKQKRQQRQPILRRFFMIFHLSVISAGLSVKPSWFDARPRAMHSNPARGRCRERHWPGINHGTGCLRSIDSSHCSMLPRAVEVIAAQRNGRAAVSASCQDLADPDAALLEEVRRSAMYRRHSR